MGELDYAILMERRTLLKTGLLGTGLTLTAPSALAPTALARVAEPLAKTPRDAEGPFYPMESRAADTPDLLRDMTTPRGKILHFHGTLVGTDAAPLDGRIIDIWHTDPKGRYKHPYDGAPGERLTDFAYFGKAVTDANGRYEFRTYIPGAYGGRPAHIHYIVWQADKRVLTSQVYFKGFDKGSGPVIESTRHDLRKADLTPRGDGSFETDFRIVV